VGSQPWWACVLCFLAAFRCVSVQSLFQFGCLFPRWPVYMTVMSSRPRPRARARPGPSTSRPDQSQGHESRSGPDPMSRLWSVLPQQKLRYAVRLPVWQVTGRGVHSRGGGDGVSEHRLSWRLVKLFTPRNNAGLLLLLLICWNASAL